MIMLAPLRLIAVGNMYPPHHLGGYEVVWRSAVEHLRAQGHAVRILTTDFRLERPDASLDEDQDVHRELRWYWHDHEFPRMSLLERARLERHNRALFDTHVRDFRPDCVSWWAMGGMSLSLIRRGRRHRLPALGVVHDDWPIYGPKVDAWSKLFGVRLAGAASWSFNSKLQRERVRRALPEGGRVDYPGIDTRLFREAPASKWNWRLLYCGRLDVRKGVDLAVRALAELPGAQLRIVGGGDERYRAELLELAAMLGVQDRLRIERLDRDELPDVYATADVLLFPVRWSEPFGLVPLEAMAVGTPVVASGRVGGGEYMLEGENCLIADPDAGPGELAMAVRRLAEDDALRAQLRSGGIATAARFSEQRFNEAIETALLEVVAK